jgi:predicted transcriptional regulator of viral defense system
MNNLELFYTLAPSKLFHFADVVAFKKDPWTAYGALKRLIKLGYVSKVRNDLYACIDASTGYPYASKFEIATALYPDAYITHYTASEYQGMANQVLRGVFVATKCKFKTFEYDDDLYIKVPYNEFLNIIVDPNNPFVRLPDLESTLISSIMDSERIAGLEEVRNFILQAPAPLRQDVVITILDRYNKAFLYQKVGYMLYTGRKRLHLSDDFFTYCKSKIGKSVRYLDPKGLLKGKSSYHYNKEWQLVVPNWYLQYKGLPDKELLE